MATEDLYQILGVSKKASEKEIKKAYRAKSKQSHPDVGGNEEEFKKISHANDILSDKEKRALYDQYGHDMGRRAQSQSSQDDLQDFIRRTHAQFFAGFAQDESAATPLKPSPIRLNVGLNIKDIYNGVSKKFKYNANRVCSHCDGLKYVLEDGGHEEVCSTCNGNGFTVLNQGNFQIRQTCPSCNGVGSHIHNGCKVCNETGYQKIEQVVEINIPKGAPNGSFMEIEGKGNEMNISSKKVIGDLLIVINEIQDSVFTRHGNDLHCVLEVPIISCILGDEVTVNSIDDKPRKFKLKVGTESDEKFRLTGLGMPMVNTDNTGDFYVHIKHKMSNKLSEKEKELLNELKNHKEDGE